MTKESLQQLTEAELEKILYTLEKIDSTPIESINLSRTSHYTQSSNEYILKTDKVYQDEYLKLTINHA